MEKPNKEFRAATDPQRWVNADGVKADTQKKIQIRAYELYEARGSQPGHDVEDWIQAEMEISNPGKMNQAA